MPSLKPGINSQNEVPLTNPSFHLYQLQKVDLRVDQINLRLAKIASLIANNPQLIAADAELKESQGKVDQKEKELTALGELASTKKIKIEQSESALYSGKNTNPKELKDLQAEIESLKRSLSTLEEDELSLMTLLDDLNRDLKHKQENYKACSIECEKNNMSLYAEKGNMEKEKEKLLTERQAALGQISSQVAASYDKLRAAKNHIAVTSIEDQSCATCGAEITASDIQKARSSTYLTYCPSCGRIIYAG
jgi:predicted  nucleic acid-binding Zn-ribbon protein